MIALLPVCALLPLSFSPSLLPPSSLLPLAVCPLAGRAICYAIIRAYSAQPPLQQLPHQSPSHFPPPAPSALPAPHLGNSPLNAHCRLMKDLCGAINMKSCCEMRFHLNVIKHTMSLPHTALPLYLPLSPSLSVSLSLTHPLFFLAAGGPESCFSAASTSQGEYPLRYYQKKGDKLKKSEL